jgi:hypothetical protein
MMKKLFIYGIVFAICLAAGCKKDNKAIKTYLLKQQITDDRVDGVPLDTVNYSYDDSNRPISISDFSGQSKVRFDITYDNQNRVSTAKKFGSNGDLIIEYDFFYTGGNAGYYFYGPSHAADTASFVFNDKHQVSEIDSKHSGRTTFKYDTRGNVATTQDYDANGSYNFSDENDYTYDSMKNPFSQMLPVNNLFFQYILFIDNPSTLVNNVASKNGERFIYTYNADGFPVNADITTYANNHIKINYSYIVK